ncbi:MAG: hypothetical protein ACI37U_05785 [Bacteroides sp.]
MALCLVMLASCSEEAAPVLPDDDNAANLTLRLEVPKVHVSTRAGYSNPDSDPATWTNWERAVDGRMFYHLTLFLLDKDKRLVGYRDLYSGSSDIKASTDPEGENGFTATDEAVVTFNYLYPLHGNASTSKERLKGERYMLIAVANYSDYTYGGNSYSGLSGVETQITNATTAFNADPATGIADFITTYSTLFYSKIDAGSDRICPQQPQPLVLVKYIDLHPGENNVTGELLRTYSRIRIEVQNNSDKQDLSVNGLSFCNYFAQQSAYLFYNPDDIDSRFDASSAGALTVTSTDAIVPYHDRTIAKRGGSGGGGMNSAVVFDAYILESKQTSGDAYTYRLNVAYSSVSDYGQYTLSDPVTGIGEVSTINSNYASDTKYYVIQNRGNTGVFFKSTTTGSIAGGNESTSIANIRSEIENKNYTHIWELEQQSGSSYYLKSVGKTSYYLGNNARDANIPLLATKSAYYTLSTVDGYLALKSSQGEKDYINVYNNNNPPIISGWYEADNNSQFLFYPVSASIGSPTFDSDIVLKTIDPITSVVTPVTRIDRNDFINVLVTVAYNDQAGEFMFEVEHWNEKNEDISYD